jgi:hypothetical protein
MNLREISRAALLAVAGLVLPVVFHALHLGHVFLPMYLPILVGAFVLGPRWAAIVGIATPLISAIATGMPPFFPPIAVWMALELGAMALLAAIARKHTSLPVPLILAAALVLGRVLYLGLTYLTAVWLQLPPALLTIASLVSAWPGMLLAMAVVPATVAAVERLTLKPSPTTRQEPT